MQTSNSDERSVLVIADAETTSRVQELCAAQSLTCQTLSDDEPGLGFGDAMSSSLIVGALSAVVTGVCAVLRALLKERKRVIVIESASQKIRLENIDEEEVRQILAAAKDRVEIRLIGGIAGCRRIAGRPLKAIIAEHPDFFYGLSRAATNNLRLS